MSNESGELYEVFLQLGTTKNYEHAGHIHAFDKTLAMQAARDVYARRDKVTGIWIVPSKEIIATTPEQSGPYFDPSFTTPYRHAQFYTIPTGKDK